MILFLQTSTVFAIGSVPLTRVSSGNELLVANFYNAASVTRTVAITTSGNTFSFDLAASAAATIALEREGDLSVSANGLGVSCWVGKRVRG